MAEAQFYAGQPNDTANKMGNESQNIVASNSCPPPTTIRVPDFTVNEFARLCVLLRDDDQCRSNVHGATGLELSRRFNNPSVLTVEDFRGVVDGMGLEAGVNEDGDGDDELQPKKKKRPSADSTSFKNLESCLAQVSKSSLHISEALNRNNKSILADERDSRIHQKLELLRAELRNRRQDKNYKDDDDGAEAQSFLREMSVKDINNLMDSMKEERGESEGLSHGPFTLRCNVLEDTSRRVAVRPSSQWHVLADGIGLGVNSLYPPPDADVIPPNNGTAGLAGVAISGAGAVGLPLLKVSTYALLFERRPPPTLYFLLFPAEEVVQDGAAEYGTGALAVEATDVALPSSPPMLLSKEPGYDDNGLKRVDLCS
ncbi:hypothetical protein FGB62_243g016 [Gracilaria domingensis]|nr:hypothetical protein FGB62_243g016 [Gracilaria domingensis]